jgi:hypothetical protein
MKISSYKFETDQIGVSDHAVHLLRSGFNFDTLEFTTIDKITIEKGRQVNNWLLLLVVGLGLLGFGVFTAIKVVYEYFFANNFQRFYIEQFVIPVLPLAFGLSSIFYSLKTGAVLKISIKQKTKQFPIDELRKKSQMEAFVHFFQQNNLTANKFELKCKIE